MKCDLFYNLKIINPEPVKKAIQDWKCGRTHVATINSTDVEQRHYHIPPLEGFEYPSEFPKCCKHHTQLLESGFAYFYKFPNCCDAHRKLSSLNWFKKDNYYYLPIKLVTTVAYTFYCVAKCIENVNWYKEITDYIDIIQKSYGQLPEGFGNPVGWDVYMFHIKDRLKRLALPEYKKNRILEYLERYTQPVDKKNPIDLNLLIDKYKEWLKIFPFELSFFKHLKPKLEKQVPILKNKLDENIYTGEVSYSVKTPEEMTEYLISITKTIIGEINTLHLFEKGLITDVDKLSLELIISERRIGIQALQSQNLDNPIKYIGILNQWLEGEKKFIKEIGPYVKNLPAKDESDMKEKNTDDSNMDFEDFIKWLEDNDVKSFEQFISGLQEMEGYVHKNVFENVHADLPRLKQLNRNLTNWKHQVRSVWIEPVKVTRLFNSQHLNEKGQQAVLRLENKIIGALEVLRLRIKDKEEGGAPSSNREIYLNESIIPELHKTLMGKFYDPENLLKALKGETLQQAIQFKLKAKLLCQIFKFLHEIGVIHCTERETKIWLIKNFTITEKQKPKQLKAATVDDYFKERQVSAPIPELSYLETK